MKRKYFINHTHLKTYLLIGVLLIIVVFYLSLVPIKEEILTIQYSDKIIHFLIYFFLTKWFCDLFQKKYFIAVTIYFLFQGFLIELLQSQTEFRSYENLDILANGTGSAFSLLFLSYNIISQVDKILINFGKK